MSRSSCPSVRFVPRGEKEVHTFLDGETLYRVRACGTCGVYSKCLYECANLYCPYGNSLLDKHERMTWQHLTAIDAWSGVCQDCRVCSGCQGTTQKLDNSPLPIYVPTSQQHVPEAGVSEDSFVDRVESERPFSELTPGQRCAWRVLDAGSGRPFAEFRVFGDEPVDQHIDPGAKEGTDLRPTMGMDERIRRLFGTP